MNLKSPPHEDSPKISVLNLYFLGLPLTIWLLTFVLVFTFLIVMIFIVKKWTSDYYSVYWSDDDFIENHTMMTEDQDGQMMFDALLWNNSNKKKSKKQESGMNMAKVLAQSHGNGQAVVFPELARKDRRVSESLSENNKNFNENNNNFPILI